MTADTITQLNLAVGAVLGGLAKLGTMTLTKKTGAKRRRRRIDQ